MFVSFLLKPQVPAGECRRHPDDAQPAVPGSGGGAVVCPRIECQAGRRVSPSLSAATLRSGGGGARSLDRHPHWTQWERCGFCKSATLVVMELGWLETSVKALDEGTRRSNNSLITK